MNLATQHIYLMFDIHYRFIQHIGTVKILIQKERDIEKWKNPDLVKQEAIDFYKSETPQYKEQKLMAFYTGDFIPYV